MFKVLHKMYDWHQKWPHHMILRWRRSKRDNSKYDPSAWRHNMAEVDETKVIGEPDGKFY